MARFDDNTGKAEGPSSCEGDAPQQQAAAKRLVFPLSFNLGPRQYDEQYFDFFASLNESAGEFGHFPIGRDLLWHGGIHLFHEENAPVFNVYAGRIVAAKLQRPGREDAEKPSNGFVIIRHVFSSAADKGNDGKPFYSLHMHLADEVLGESTVPWLMRIGEKYGKGGNSRTPNTTLSADTPQVLKDLCDGKYVVLGDEHGLDRILSVAAGEQIGRCHRVPSVGGARVFGEHFEIFSAHDFLAGETAADFSEVSAPEAPCKLVMRQKSFSRPDSGGYVRPDMGKKSDNEKRNPAMNVACDVLGLHEYRGEKYAYVETESGKRWVLYQKEETAYGALTALPQQKWYKIADAASDLKYDTASMRKIFDIITKADPGFSAPGGIIKRAELERFYRSNEKAKLFRFTYLDSVSEWSIDPARALSDPRVQYLPKEEADALKEELERFGLWKNLTGIEKLDGFAKSIEGGAVRHYRYHPVMFLWWLERTVGAVCHMPEIKSRTAGMAAERETPANEIEDSVGVGGANKADDVLIVQRRLAELGYPVKDINGRCENDTITSIKMFQIALVDIVKYIRNYSTIPLPDGLVSPGGSAHERLFHSDAPRYVPKQKGRVKQIQGAVRQKMSECPEHEKKYWERIHAIWNEISPYLPEDSEMISGYRSTDSQRRLLHDFYNSKYKDSIIAQFGENEWKKYKNMQNVNDAAADPAMCMMIRKATGQLIAVPGTSSHQKGRAIDIGGADDAEQVRSLLWCHVVFYEQKRVTKILPERNGCVHFEFGE